MYSQADFDRNKKQRSKVLGLMLLCALPGFVLGGIGAAMRIELMCSAGLLVSGAVLIFLYDLKLKPVLRYGKYLAEANSGLSHRTAGTLVRIGVDPVYMDGVWFYEAILNVYEDLSEEGERRFLYDCTKDAPKELVGRDVVLMSHGNYVLDLQLM